MFTYQKILLSEEHVISLLRHDQKNSTVFLALNLGSSGKIPCRPREVLFSLQRCINVRKELPSRLLN
jgi:hypothetical protein